MSTSQEYKFNEQKPVDLVKAFYDQDIDHKALEKALVQKQNTAKSITNFSLDPYTGEFGPKQMVKEFDEVVFNEAVNVVHGPVKTQFGYHLLEVTSRTD